MYKSIKFKLIFILTFMFLINVTLPGKADLVLKSLNKPISLISEKDLSIEKSNVGDLFSLLVPEKIIYKDSVIESGTVLKGKLLKLKDKAL